MYKVGLPENGNSCDYPLEDHQNFDKLTHMAIRICYRADIYI